MRSASAFAPGHITGFFKICDELENPLMNGSRGAGVSLSKGARTTVRLEPATSSLLEVKINGCITDSAIVSEHVAKRLLSEAKGNYKTVVEHCIEVPIGVGMGMSGAGALSLALALNDALDLGWSKEEVAQVAHIAEVECKTGLGTIIAETYGGMEIRVKSGAPDVGEIMKVPLRGEYVVVCLPFGQISTRSILTNELFRKRINELGDLFVQELLSKPEPEEFMILSRRFAEHVGLITERVRGVLEETDDVGLLCSMPMFGEAVFSLLKRGDAKDLMTILRRHQAPSISVSEIDEVVSNIILAEVDEAGVRLI